MRPTGYKKDRPDPRDWTIARLIANPHDVAQRKLSDVGPGDLPDSVNLCGYVKKIRDQGAGSSCVGQAFARCLHVRALVTTPTAAQAAIPFPSVQGIYGMALAIDAGDPSAPLVDAGCAPRSAAKGVSDVGWCDEARYPYDVGTLTDRPPWDVLQASDGNRTSDYYRVDMAQPRSAIVDDVRRALAHGYPLAIGVPAGQLLQDYVGGRLLQPEPDLTVDGGHMLAVLGFHTLISGERVFMGVNSWGSGWGQGGFFEASEAWLTDPRVSDLYVLSGVKKP